MKYIIKFGTGVKQEYRRDSLFPHAFQSFLGRYISTRELTTGACNPQTCHPKTNSH